VTVARKRANKRLRPVHVGVLRAHATSRTRVNDRGQIEPYWRVRRGGDQASIWNGYGTREEIEERLVRMVADRRTAPAPRVEAPAAIETLGQLAQDWYDYQKSRPDLAPSTVNNYQKGARHLIAWLGNVRVARIDQPAAEEYRDNRLREGAAPRTVELELRILRMIWTWGRRRGLAPARDLGRVPVKIDGYRLNHRTPTPVEVGKVLAVLDGVFLLVVRLLAITGARVSEVCALEPGSLEQENGLLALDGKTGRREFPLPADIAAELGRHFEGCPGPLVPGSRLAPAQKVRDRLDLACTAAKVPRFTPHGLRRMVVDRMIRGGVEPATAAALTGHSVVVMLRFYRKVTEADRRRAVLQAELGRFPSVGQVIEGPWEGAEKGAATGSKGGDLGTEFRHNHDK